MCGLSELTRLSPDENILLSPLSVHTVLSLLQFGAAGRSRGQLRRVLGLADLPRAAHYSGMSALIQDYRGLQGENVTLTIANGLFTAKDLTIKEEFSRLAKSVFASEAESLDFTAKQEAVRQINSWAENRTGGLVSELVTEESVGENTRLVISNAVYFKAKWLKPFLKEETKLMKFRGIAGAEFDTEFMVVSEPLRTTEDAVLGATILFLPYVDRRFEMVILHPHKDSSLQQVEEKLLEDPEYIDQYLGLPYVTEETTTLILPKFVAHSDLSLVQSFKNLNLTDIFSDNANFSKITDEMNIRVGNIIHKTVLEVSEEGSEAAAVSGAVLDTRFGGSKRLSIDSPFLFIIRDTTNRIPLFVGRILDPRPAVSSDPATLPLAPLSSPRVPPSICPGGDIDICSDSCLDPDLRVHLLCIRSCVKKCPA